MEKRQTVQHQNILFKNKERLKNYISYKNKNIKEN